MISKRPVRNAADHRDQEILRLKRRLVESRERELSARAEERERFSALTSASKRFASSMRSRLDERQRQQRRLDAQYAVSRVLEEALSLEEAAPGVFRALGSRLGWRVGVLWTVQGGALRCDGLWRAGGPGPESPDGSGGFGGACRGHRFPKGAGLPGRVWRREAPCWVENVLADEGDVRRDAAAAEDLRCALAFPIQDGGSLVGVFELLKKEPSPEDEDMLRTAYLVGHQMGQFVERRRAEAERDRALFREREARKQTDNILESINDAFLAVDRDWRFTYVNRRTEEFWDRSRDGLLGANVWEELPETIGTEVERSLRRAMDTGETVGFETLSFAPGAPGVWVSARAYPSPDGLSVYFQDISERREAEAALRESEERFRAIADLVPDLLWSNDASGRTRWLNGRWLEYTGQSSSEAPDPGWFDAIYPDDRERSREEFLRAVETGEPLRQEHRIRRADGSFRWFLVRAEPVTGEDGRILRWFGAATDVHEQRTALEALRENEAWLGLAQQAARSGTWEWDLLSGEIRWSAEHRELFGFDPSDEPVEREDWWAAIHPDDLPRIKEAGRRCSENGEEWPEIDYRIFRGGNGHGGDGETRWINTRGRTAGGHGGRPGRILGISVDVTDQKRAEKERDRLLAREWVARAEVAERERISRELHDRVAHSMAVAHQSLQLHGVLARTDPARAALKLKTAQEMTKTALESTRNLSMELRRQEAEEGLKPALQDLLKVAVPPRVNAGLHARGDESHVPPHVRGQLFSILREGVRNAVSHSGCRSIRVEFEVSPGEAVGRVEDDGRGLASDGAADGTADGGAGGSGSGLRSMRERARLLGGVFRLRSSPAGGTSVEVAVPLNGAG